MNTKILPKSRSLSRFLTSIPLVDQVAKSLLCSQLSKIKHGTLTIIDQNGILHFGQGEEIKVTLTVKKSSFYSRTLIGGSIGNAESYVDNDWDCTNLTDLIRLFVKNRDVLQKIDGSVVNLLSPMQKVFHGFRSNTLEGSKENIRSHYDMGNDFFGLFLDSTMMYSCAIFDSKTSTLEEASQKKIQTICKKLELKETDHLLEIGTGWGAVAIYAATQYGCKVTTTTISREQFEYTLSKVKSLGLENKISVLFQDYRDLQGTYDKLVSVEMIEAVGLNNLDTYFEVCSRLLKADGLMVLQAITIRDQYYAGAKNSVDFIQRHIFPGSGIPSVNSIMNSVTKKSDMILIQQQDYAEDYAQTLWHWSQRFTNKTQEVLDLGYPEFLPRLWQFYFSYCEGAFRERAIGLSQIVFAKPRYINRSLI
jgi:cyclopropane-fatty-acyl-phospholipid synthase